MKKTIFFFVFLSFITYCSPPSEKLESENHFSHVFKVQQFGDTVRIEIEKRGDTIIKHYIDLKGGSDDNFDNSYTAKIIYETKLADTIIEVANKKIKIKALLTESFKTEFSGGTNMYGITAKGDTVFIQCLKSYIK